MKEIQKIVQTLDLEENCVGVYSQDKFYFKDTKKGLEKAKLSWRHSPLFEKDEEWEFISLYCKDQKLSDFSSDPVALEIVNKLLEAQKKAALTAKLDFSNLCFYDLLPDHLLKRWFSLREQAMHRIVADVEKPKEYNILHKIHVVVSSISRQSIKVGNAKEKVIYDMHSSATGRLATSRGSYPILNISKDERASITPRNDMFLELDVNGAEIRTLLSLSGQKQPDYDIHDFNRDRCFPDLSRKDVKAKFFAWLYNPNAVDYKLEKIYNKNIYKDYFRDNKVTTPFNRELKVDERRALNYLLQSTTSDIVLENAYKIMKVLKPRKSKVAFTMHDSVVLDFAREDYDLVKDIKEMFETNMFGRFVSTISIGKNFGNLKEISI